MKEFSLLVFSTLSKRISLRGYPSGIWLVFVCLLGILATNTLDREAEPIELLFKNETTLKTANHSFLANFLDLMPRTLAANSNNDSICDIAYFDELAKNCFINRCISIDSFVFFYTLQRMTFPYAPVISELPTFSNFEDDRTYNKNIKECVFLLEGIYTSVFNQVATDYCSKESVLYDETISNKIREILDPILDEAFILQPTIMGFIRSISNLRGKNFSDSQLKEILSRIKVEIFHNEVFVRKYGITIVNLDKLPWKKTPERELSIKNSEESCDLFEKYEEIHEEVAFFLKGLITSKPTLGAKDDNELFENFIQIKNNAEEFGKLNSLINSFMNFRTRLNSQKFQNPTEHCLIPYVNFCIMNLLGLVSFYKNVDNNKICFQILEKVEGFLQDKFFGCLEERFRYINQEYEQIIWIPDLMTKSLSYVWETARKIDMCPEYS